MKRSRMPIILMTLLATLALGAGAGAVAYSTLSSSKTVVREVSVTNSEPAATKTGLSVHDVYQRAYRGVVEITVTSVQSTPSFGQPGQQEQKAQGSGFVVDSKGDIVTNEHVVDGAKSVSIRFWNGDTYNASVVGSDPSTDLAVVKVDAPSSILHQLTVGDSGTLQVGDGVVAIGSPFGLEETVTSGIVSALHRSMQAPNNFTINDSIQTDAAINHGNSGGPLLNLRGEVVGVNSQIRSDSGGSDGVGFAIPSNTVNRIATQLIGSGKVEHAYLGVQVQTIPSTVASQLSLVEGIELTKVLNGKPADKAGLHASTGEKTVENDVYATGGDVVTEVDGQKVTTSEQLQRAIDAKHPGDTVSITYWRSGATHTVKVTLASRPNSPQPS